MSRYFNYDPIYQDRALEIHKELEARDWPREDLMKLLAATKAENERLRERKADLDTVRMTFPECCRVPVAVDPVELVDDQLVENLGRTSITTYAHFKPCRLVVDPECAPYFDIVDFKVGRNSQNLNSNPWPATLFPPLPSEREDAKKAHEALAMRLRTIQVGTPWSLYIHLRPGHGKRVFRAALWGAYAG
jgi:hypothetical protein